MKLSISEICGRALLGLGLLTVTTANASAEPLRACSAQQGQAVNACVAACASQAQCKPAASWVSVDAIADNLKNEAPCAGDIELVEARVERLVRRWNPVLELMTRQKLLPKSASARLRQLARLYVAQCDEQLGNNEDDDSDEDDQGGDGDQTTGNKPDDRRPGDRK